MTRRISLSPRAEADIDSIGEWIAAKGSPLSALNYVRRIRAYIADLRHFPERGRPVEYIRPGLRVTNFERRVVIVFIVRADRVDVQRVFYGGRDWERTLLDE